MIIIDLSQVMIATLMTQLGNHTNAELDENLLRHMVLNSIRANKVKFSEQYGEFIIAADGKRSWRKEVYPFYKANRKRDRDASELNWTLIFESLNKIREELKEYFPYRVIHIDNAEADDVIATLVKNRQNAFEKTLVLSGDKDFQQLQRYPNVFQYSPVLKKYLTCKNPDSYLREHIIRGDVGDGVPNFLSADDVLVTGTRQKNISSKKLEQWLNQDPEQFCTVDMLRGFKRNQQLVDFDYIPKNVEDQIMAEYESQSGKGRSKLFNYFIANKLKGLTEAINDF
jgi:5'-3' exonuclease